MELITWREMFETGYIRVDNQHKHLVQLINDLSKHIGSKNNESQIRLVFLELFEYTVIHFSMEEMLMKEFDYPDYMKHKDEHSQFIIQIKDFKEKYLSGDAKVNVKLLNYLKEWLLKHIMCTDKATFEVIKGITG